MSDRLSQSQLRELWDFADLVGSESRFRQAIDSEPHPDIRAELATQLARALGLQGRFDEADRELDAIRSDSPIVAVRVALERGRVCNTSSDRDKALSLFSTALDLAREGGFAYLAVDAAHMLAIADSHRGEQWNRIAFALIDESTDDDVKGWAIALRNNRGWELHGRGDHDAALTEFERAREAASSYGSALQLHIAEWAVARCLRSLGRSDEALAIQERLLANDPADHYVVEEIEILRGGAPA